MDVGRDASNKIAVFVVANISGSIMMIDMKFMLDIYIE